MIISKSLVIKILKYLDKHRCFYFPFSMICREFIDDGDFVEIDIDNFVKIKRDRKYKNFEIVENLQDLRGGTTELMAKGFIEKITNKSLENHIAILARNYRKEWKEKLCESEDIEEYGLNGFVGGKADAYEECLQLIKQFKK